ncbi:MAG: hydroxyisourate hydrolase [Candidatus Limnocylindria bacterium]
MAGPSLSTHVLDTGTGRPAAGVAVSVYRGDDLLGSGTTDADGRVKELATGALAEGTHRIVFEVGAYFSGDEGPFFRRVALDVELGAAGHYHVPLLVSRYGCVSYRGS